MNSFHFYTFVCVRKSLGWISAIDQHEIKWVPWHAVRGRADQPQIFKFMFHCGRGGALLLSELPPVAMSLCFWMVFLQRGRIWPSGIPGGGASQLSPPVLYLRDIGKIGYSRDWRQYVSARFSFASYGFMGIYVPAQLYWVGRGDENSFHVKNERFTCPCNTVPFIFY